MKYDYLIVGAGIIGLTIAYQLKEKEPDSNIVIIDKESDVAKHASGRNSGVLHAGFYYTADSLKARFTVEGNRLMKEFCSEHDIHVRQTQKVVIAQNKSELQSLEELKKRGDINGVETSLIDISELEKMDYNVKSYKKALFSPTTASVNPKDVCQALKNTLIQQGVKFYFNQTFIRKECIVDYDHLINAAGLYADKVAHSFGVGKNYTILPFKGIYLKSLDDKCSLKMNVYPVPNLNNPFLGVHFTVTEDGSVKIGPTAIPALWRENYKGLSRFKFLEFCEIFYLEMWLFITNRINFRLIALEEISNYRRKNFISKAKKMLKSMREDFKPMPAGIRAQLYDKIERKLEMDFVIQHGPSSTHILNAVSPAFTCSFAFAKYIVDEIKKDNRKKDD